MWEKSKRNREDWKYHRDELNVKLNWRHANFSQSEARFTRSDQLCLLKSQILLKTNFSNNTDREQEYSLKLTSRNYLLLKFNPHANQLFLVLKNFEYIFYLRCFL
jgi:hypothetical protein